MAHFCLTGNYTPAALKALGETPSDRQEAARKLVEAGGGRLISFYRTAASGPGVHIIYEADPISALAINVVVAAGGALTDMNWTRLWTNEEVGEMRAKRKQLEGAYKAPG